MSHQRVRFHALAFAAAGLLVLVLGIQVFAATQSTSWRIKINDAAIVAGANVGLSEIAMPFGDVDQATWQELANKELWPAPNKELRPMAIGRSKLKDVLIQYLGKDVADLCILPGSLALQRGGAVVLEDELMRLVVKTLTPMAGTLNGEAELRNFRIPKFIFLSDHANSLEVELGGKTLRAGRVPLVFKEVGLDGRVRRKVSGGVHMDVWKAVAVASSPINSGEAVTPDKITFVRKNLAHLRREVWDGKSGGMRVRRSVGAKEVLYLENLESIPLVAKGDVVRMIYRGKHISLEVPAQIMEDGGYNERIPVRNLQSEVQVYAWVVDARTVQVR